MMQSCIASRKSSIWRSCPVLRYVCNVNVDEACSLTCICQIMTDVGSHHFVKGQNGVLVPQPSDDPHDPLVCRLCHSIKNTTHQHIIHRTGQSSGSSLPSHPALSSPFHKALDPSLSLLPLDTTLKSSTAPSPTLSNSPGLVFSFLDSATSSGCH
jgi:hypothetical protein